MTDKAHIEAVAHQNKPRLGEHWAVYLQRLCVLSGLIRPEDTSGPPLDGWVDAGQVLEQAEKEAWWQR